MADPQFHIEQIAVAAEEEGKPTGALSLPPAEFATSPLQRHVEEEEDDDDEYERDVQEIERYKQEAQQEKEIEAPVIRSKEEISTTIEEEDDEEDAAENTTSDSEPDRKSEIGS